MSLASCTPAIVFELQRGTLNKTNVCNALVSGEK